MTVRTKILIVDDDKGSCNSMLDILEAKDYDVELENSGSKAIAKMKEEFFNIVIMDIKMPVMNGVETYKRIKNISPQTVVIMMTAYSVEELIKNALKEGAYGVLYKPLDMEKLIKMIESAERDKYLIMIVDNNVNVRQSLKNILDDKGYVVTLTDSVGKAIDIVKEIPHDIIFVDMSLPFLNGLVTFLTIQNVSPKVTTVIMTGYKQEIKNSAEIVLKQGTYDCLYKPFVPKEVIAIIDKIKEKNKK